jgi:cell division protein FtsB
MIRQSKNDLSLMTLDELEKLLFDKDRTIKALGLELKATKDENDSNYAKLGELNRKIAELEQNLKYKDINNQNNLNNEIFDNLRKQLEEKNKLIEEEREKIDRIKNEFAKLYQDKKLAEDEVKLESSVFVPEKSIVNKEKSELYTKINNLRKVNKKLNDELKKLENILKEKDAELKELNNKYEKEKENGKEILKSQYKDTKRISQLKKEKEKLEKNNDKLRDEIDKLKSKIIELEEENRKNSQSNLRTRPQRTINREISENNFNNLNEINTNINERNLRSSNLSIQNLNYNIPSITNKEINSNLDQEDLIKRLINFCLNKNIILSKQFEKYDLVNDNKIVSKDFKNAIEQLQPGFIEPELNELVKMGKPDINNNIKYKDFIQLMVNKNNNYKELEEQNKNINDKVLTKKYNPFENKSYNINY